MTKYIVMCDHGQSGMDRVWSRPAGDWWDALLLFSYCVCVSPPDDKVKRDVFFNSLPYP